MLFFKKKNCSKKKNLIFLVIPLLLFISGASILSFAGWRLFKETYISSKTIFSKRAVAVSENKFVINNMTMYRPKLGAVMGKVTIPSISLEYPLIHGDDDSELSKGIGHDPGTTLPGENGNVVITGHRDTVFRNLGKVQEGDLVKLNTYYGNFTYKVSKIRIVDEDDKTVIVRSDKEMLTIYTCYPFEYIGHATKRYVLVCDLVEGSAAKEMTVEGAK